ncbi:MAG: glycerol-3-phosphate dehydrogenase [Oxalicibacterium faecigallinarum]|uniref:glycerol-3-phosphate dehydrogenase n=1 Tax=Oxalicibacterium faecigallinarum TaxID=573741 RepID=UPI002807A443|nr:glycerol-3-phosphate dehydrogenase [Oxalicibacterium faecigallinarum]MDQ7968068.1 glycerol-3-phosphate dehydrogenase [Oxalicibacterium faecigallinarum]
MEQAYDILVIGGGINGAGIARDASGRGLSVVLCEKDALAAHTSSASTKLIHGGLRYLEQYEFALVRKALIEREVLMRIAPHIIHPLRFVMPHDQGQRPAWLIRLGLFLYDHLARRALLPGSAGIDLRQHPTGRPLKPGFVKGFAYSDAWVDDTRLVELNALDAKERGATVLTHTRCIAVTRHTDHWLAVLQSSDGQQQTVRANALVNATGPWAAQFLHDTVHGRSSKSLRLVKGSHIVVRKLFDHDYAYIFQNSDGRIVFAIPYQHDYTLVGTTDVEYRGDPDHVAITPEETDYLCTLINRYFTRTISPADVVHSFSGVRPLVNDDDHQRTTAAAVTRDYKLELEKSAAPVLTVFGGKLTTYRKLAEEAVDLLAPLLGNNHARWTAHACLPGGDLAGETPSNAAVTGFDQYRERTQARYSWLPPALLETYLHRYGTRIHCLLAGKNSLGDLGEKSGAGVYEAERTFRQRYEFG